MKLIPVWEEKDLEDFGRSVCGFKFPSGIDVGESGSVCQPCDGLATCPGCTPPPSHLVFYCHQPFTRLCFFQSRFTHRLERCSLDLSDVTHVCVSAACLSKLRTCPHGASEWQHTPPAPVWAEHAGTCNIKKKRKKEKQLLVYLKERREMMHVESTVGRITHAAGCFLWSFSSSFFSPHKITTVLPLEFDISLCM